VLDVLYEDNHLLAVNKPALLPTMGVAEDVPSLLTVAKEYVREKYNKPGNVYLGIVSRLDAPVTGVVLMARTSKAAGRLSAQFRERDVEKSYWAIVEGHMEPRSGTITDFVRKDERHRRMHIAAASTPGAQRAELSYHVLATDKETRRQGDKEKSRRSNSLSPCLPVSLSSHLGPVSLLEVRLLTGRKHQIRVQLSHAGFPIVGDRKYGSQRPFSPGIALHSRRLVVEHPVSKMQIEIEAAPPRSWQRLLEGNA
jgi:23S rRNA pseudouridine1911/1915/1917 synthase